VDAQDLFTQTIALSDVCRRKVMPQSCDQYRGGRCQSGAVGRRPKDICQPAQSLDSIGHDWIRALGIGLAVIWILESYRHFVVPWVPVVTVAIWRLGLIVGRIARNHLAPLRLDLFPITQEGRSQY
jgi:hypothetical protein